MSIQEKKRGSVSIFFTRKRFESSFGRLVRLSSRKGCIHWHFHGQLHNHWDHFVTRVKGFSYSVLGQHVHMAREAMKQKKSLIFMDTGAWGSCLKLIYCLLMRYTNIVTRKVHKKKADCAPWRALHLCIGRIQIKVLTILPFFFPWFLVSVDNIWKCKMCNWWKISISIQLNIEIPVMFKKNFKN